MAKKPKKAPAADGEAGAEGTPKEAPKSRKKLVIVAAAAALALALGGGGGFFLMKGRGGGGGHGDGHGDGHGAPAEEAKKSVVFLDLRELMLNLGSDPGQDKARLAKLRIALELKDAQAERDVKPLMPRIEDALQVYMREMRPSDLSGSVAIYRLREELLRRVNHAVYPAKVEAVLFKDLIVQ